MHLHISSEQTTRNEKSSKSIWDRQNGSTTTIWYGRCVTSLFKSDQLDTNNCDSAGLQWPRAYWMEMITAITGLCVRAIFSLNWKIANYYVLLRSPPYVQRSAACHDRDTSPQTICSKYSLAHTHTRMSHSKIIFHSWQEWRVEGEAPALGIHSRSQYRFWKSLRRLMVFVLYCMCKYHYAAGST